MCYRNMIFFCRDLTVFLETRHQIRHTGRRDMGTREHRMLEGTGHARHVGHMSLLTGVFEN